MGGFKDKDLMADTGGKTKVQKNYGGQNKRPPRMQQRKEQRNRFLTKENKVDMKQSFDSQEKVKNAEQIDLQIGDDGLVYVNDQPSANTVKSFSDLVNIPHQVKNIRDYDDYNTSLNNSMNDDSRYDIQLNDDVQTTDISMDSFDFKDDDSPQIQQADVSNNDVILSQEEEAEQSNPFDSLFDDSSEDSQQENTQEETTTEQEETVQQENAQEKTEESNDSIDEYLNMQIDDSKLSEQNKKKLDSFTDQQLDAFKKFLYQKKNQE